MKITITEKRSEIECTAEELRASNTLADNVANLLRSIFRPGEPLGNDEEDDYGQEGSEDV